MIPALLLEDDAFVKTRNFRDATYIGDPINVINLFNRFEVDEIVLLDIGATVNQREPSFDLIRQLAAECWVPLTYGGGVRSFGQAKQILGSGVEKVVFGTALETAPDAVSSVAEAFGRQAVVAAVDVRRTNSTTEVFVENGRRSVRSSAAEWAQRAVALGAGEILVNSIDRDGTMSGFDLDLIRTVAAAVKTPVVALGGAASRSDLPQPIAVGASAVAAGSLFVFQGAARGVLVNFPERNELEGLFAGMPVRGTIEPSVRPA